MTTRRSSNTTPRSAAHTPLARPLTLPAAQSSSRSSLVRLSSSRPTRPATSPRTLAQVTRTSALRSRTSLSSLRRRAVFSAPHLPFRSGRLPAEVALVPSFQFGLGRRLSRRSQAPLPRFTPALLSSSTWRPTSACPPVLSLACPSSSSCRSLQTTSTRRSRRSTTPACAS